MQAPWNQGLVDLVVDAVLDTELVSGEPLTDTEITAAAVAAFGADQPTHTLVAFALAVRDAVDARHVTQWWNEIDTVTLVTV